MPVLSLPGEITETGLTLPENLPYDEWREIGRQLQRAERSLMWWIGDWWAYGEHTYGSRKELVESEGLSGASYKTCKNAASICREFERSRRRDLLSFTHHAEVASLPPEQADQILDWCEETIPETGEARSTREARQRVYQIKNTQKLLEAEQPDNTTCTVADLIRLSNQGRKFGCIYADPPWQYDNQATRASTENHYSGMTVNELCALPVAELAADDAHLHLWTTNAFLFECPRIFDAWGFEFRSSLVWVKPQMGIGNYWRNSHEFLLTAIRGDAKRFNDKSLKSWLQANRTAHSAKPELVRQFIERASFGPYLELFGRRIAPNWTVWGNQIERSIFDAEVREVA